MPSVVSLAIIILGSVILSVVLAVVMGKRKLSQRKECSRRDPHIPGKEAKKALKREIDRRIDRISEIYYEPRLMTLEGNARNGLDTPPYYFRMKAVDNMKYLEQELTSLDGVSARTSRESIRAFLVNLSISGGVLAFVEPRAIHELCDLHEHARHLPYLFGAEQFTVYQALLSKMLKCARNRDKFAAKSGSTGGGAGASDQDSAIDESEQDHSGDDENLIISESNLVLLQRPTTLRVKADESFETSV